MLVLAWRHLACTAGRDSSIVMASLSPSACASAARTASAAHTCFAGTAGADAWQQLQLHYCHGACRNEGGATRECSKTKAHARRSRKLDQSMMLHEPLRIRLRHYCLPRGRFATRRRPLQWTRDEGSASSDASSAMDSVMVTDAQSDLAAG